MSNPFANWSAADVAAFNARKKRAMDKIDETIIAEIAVEREADLHDEIEKELKRRGWYYVHSRIDRATTQAKGVPDFIVAVPGTPDARPRTLWIEAKGKKTKITAEQLGALEWLKRSEHETAIVRNMEEFIKVIA